MAATLSGEIIVKALLNYRNALDLDTVKDDLAKTYTKKFTNGSGLNQADLIWHDQRTLSASASENLDLAAVLTDAFGTTLTFLRVKALIIAAAAGNTNNVEVGGHATAAFVNWVKDATDIVVVRPGGVLCLIAPDATAYAVTATTGDMLKVANSAGSTSVTYDVIIVGASA